MIEIKNLNISFEDKIILQNINLSFPRTGLFCVCGESGCGKSSLLNAISSIIPFSGSICIDGVEINELNDAESANFRLRNIGFVFQDFKLFNNQTVEQNIVFPLHVLSNCSDRKKRLKCNDLLEIVGLSKFNKRICNSLSGGEKQRVAIARAIINKPKIIIADEPTGSLDEKTGDEILSLLKKFSKTSLVIMVTHDLDLAKKYADNIIFIKDNHIKNVEKNNNCIEENALILSNKDTQKIKGAVPFSFAVNHAKQNMKTKKIRTILSTMFMSIGLMGIGLSISFSNSISNDIKRSYSSLVETGSISVIKESKQISNLKVASFDDVNDLVSTYKSQIPLSCGVGYKVNFEEFFKDCNEFYLQCGNDICFLNDLSIRNVNDFLAVAKINDAIFPKEINELKNDEIVLGLNISQIRSICATLKIEKSVASLSKYFENNEVKAVIELANLDWQYTDEQIFTVVGFTLSLDSYIAHSNNLFNKIVFEDNMRFPTTEKNNLKDYPWVLDKITYIETDNKYDFIKLMRDNSVLEKYLFEVIDANVFLNKYFDFATDQINCMAVYYCPDNVLSKKEIDYICSVDENLKNPIIYNKQGYINFPEHLISGFANRMYFSLSEDILFETIENNSSIVFEKNEKEVLKEGVVFSDYSQSLNNPVKFDSNLDSLVNGKRPECLEEIVVSDGLLKRLKTNGQNSDYLYVATAVKEINENLGIYNREYQISKLKIVGIIKNEESVIYHDKYWTEDYFLLKNGQKIAYLVANSISFSISDENNVDSIVVKLKRAFPQYEIINPLLSINKSIDSLCDGISIFVLCISSIALIISFILLSSCTYLHIQDIKNEIAIARCIGIDKKEANKFLYGFVFYSSLFSLIVSCLELTFMNLSISFISANILSLPFEFSINYFSYFSMCLGCFGIALASSLIISKYIGKITPADCLKT